jgi:hypothetical protein
MANKYLLSGNGIEVTYTIGGNPSFTALTVKERATTKLFKPAQITTDHTGLGTLVSVPLVLTPDTGGSRFGFFLPEVTVTLGHSVPVTTISAIETFSGPDSFPRRPTAWQCVHLHGVAEEVLLPLVDEAVTA